MSRRSGRIAPSPTPSSKRKGRLSSRARRAPKKLRAVDAAGVRPSRSAGRARGWGGCHPVAEPGGGRKAATTWLFDLDNALHDASHAGFGEMHVAIGEYVVGH